jgi:DNA-binding winged helix-turn-helix (wHTH) protein
MSEPSTMPPSPATWVLDVGGLRLCWGDVAVHLWTTECRMLEILCAAKGDPVLHESLTWEGKSGEMTSDHAVKVHVCHLRAQLRDAEVPPLIKTVHRVGYRLIHPVTVTNAGDAPVIIPGALRRPLVRLLHSHPDHREADRVLAVIA